jgi:hypothetical protein
VWVDSYGFVHLEGFAQDVGGAPNVIFYLPSADRPTAELDFPALEFSGSGVTPAVVSIRSSGAVYVIVTPGDKLSLSGISFHP